MPLDFSQFKLAPKLLLFLSALAFALCSCDAKCGGEKYDPETQRCENGVIENRCGTGNNYYNPKTKFCFKNYVIFDKCSGEEYDIATRGCEFGVIKYKCGRKEYNPETQFCSGIAVVNKCGGEEYNPEAQFCDEGAVFDKCGGRVYFPSRMQSCKGGVVFLKCGSEEYSSATQFCREGAIIDKCGGEVYEPASQLCENDTLEAKCGKIWYKAGFGSYCVDGKVTTAKGQFTDSRDGKAYKYVTIGAQTWMAENLNYAAKNSGCYKSDDRNCKKYGRLYSWAAAMALDSACDEEFCASKARAKRRGVCPGGWHLPSKAEWEVLADYAGRDSIAGTKLKAKEGWTFFSVEEEKIVQENNTDDYGFAALPDGRESAVGKIVIWWSATEEAEEIAFHADMTYNDIYGFSISSDKKFRENSVRCVRD